jgi:hypothetical protein
MSCWHESGERLSTLPFQPIVAAASWLRAGFATIRTRSPCPPHAALRSSTKWWVSSSQVLVEEVDQGGQVDDVAFAVDVQDRVFRSLHVPVDCSDFLHGLTSKRDVELAGRFEQAVLALQGARSGQGVDVCVVDQFPQTVKFPAQAMILLHVVHRREKPGADGGGDSLVHRAQPHGHLASEGQPRTTDPGPVHMWQRFETIHTAHEVPQPLAHEQPSRLADLVLTHGGGESYPFAAKTVPKSL